MSLRRRSVGRRLTADSLVIAPTERFGRIVLVAVTVVVLTVLIGAGIRYFEEQFAPTLRITGLEQENRELRATITELREALSRSRIELDVDAATRAELERQIAALNEQLKATKDELEFIRSASEESRKR